MPARADIASMALTLIGQDPVTDADIASPVTKSTRAVAVHYQPAVDELLYGNDWTFASVRAASLAPVLPAPAWDYPYAFQMPESPRYLRMRETSGCGRWSMEATADGTGHVLVADTSTISIRYTARVVEGLWPAMFVSAITYELAKRCAFAVTGKANLVDALAPEAERKLMWAKSLDGQEGSPRSYVTRALTIVRRGGRG